MYYYTVANLQLPATGCRRYLYKLKMENMKTYEEKTIYKTHDTFPPRQQTTRQQTTRQQ